MKEISTPDTSRAKAAADAVQRRLCRWLGDEGAVIASPIDGSHELIADERAHVAHAVPARIAEFAAGRWCARSALRRLGASVCVIPVGNLRQPLPPEGYLLSISHDGGVAVAMAARTDKVLGLGVDLFDLQRPLPSSLERNIANPAEIEAWKGMVTADLILPVLFACKEAAVKVQSSRAGRYLRLPEVELVPNDQTFVLRDATAHLHGCWWRTHDFIVAAAIEDIDCGSGYGRN